MILAEYSYTAYAPSTVCIECVGSNDPFQFARTTWNGEIGQEKNKRNNVQDKLRLGGCRVSRV